MALVLNDRVKETTTSTGTGTINLAGAETGFETFVAGIGNSNTCYYTISHQSANEFEVGLGTITDATPDTLARTTVISSSNSDSAVDFSAGTKDVFCTLPASKAVFEDASNNVAIPSGGVSVGGSSLDPLSLTFTGTGLALNEDSGTAFFQIDSGNGSRIDFGVGGTRNFLIYSDASNYAEFKRTTNHPILFGTNNAERMRILGGGGLQLAAGNNISNASGDLTLDVEGDIILDADGENIIFKDGGTERGQIDLGSANFTLRASTSDKDMIFRVNDGGSEIVALTIDASEAGAATFNNNVTAFSDERLKDNIETLEDGLDKVEQLRGVTYTRDEKENIGVIAQEVEKILPEIVLTADDEMGTKSVDYSRLTAVLIEAVKDLSARVKELEDK